MLISFEALGEAISQGILLVKYVQCKLDIS